MRPVATMNRKEITGTGLAASRADAFSESVIREMTRLAIQHKAINLAQGFPDFSCPDELKQAACYAVNADINQYAITWGSQDLREALAAKVSKYNHMEFDPATEITVTCGSTEAMMASMLALISPGDEVIVPEPFYENYGPDAVISGAIPQFVPITDNAPVDEEAWKAAFSKHTRAIIINTPNNPTGKVFSKEELRFIADLCIAHDVIAVTDEIMNISSMTAGSTSRSGHSLAWKTGRSPLAVFQRLTVSPGGGSGMPWPVSHSPGGYGKSMISSRSAPRHPCRQPAPWHSRYLIRIIVALPGYTSPSGRNSLRDFLMPVSGAVSRRVPTISSPISVILE